MLRTLSALCVAVAMCTAPAYASPTSETSMAVHYADLDLTSQRDAKRMLRRITRAANDVCGDRQLHVNRFGVRAFRDCRAETIAAAVRSLGAPAVTAEYARVHGVEPTILASN